MVTEIVENLAEAARRLLENLEEAEETRTEEGVEFGDISRLRNALAAYDEFTE